MENPVQLETIVSLAKRRGFVFQSSEIYGGFRAPGTTARSASELKRNVKSAWWRANVQERDDVVGLDSAILMAPQVWQASGHLANFTDPLVDCKQLQDALPRRPPREAPRCPNCGGELTEARKFNLMFKTYVGPVEEDAAVAYLRPETAQGIFVNFHNVQQSMRRKLPFGIAQNGKSFRNEITPGNFIFRTREFEQMELEYFCRPGEDELWYAALARRALQLVRAPGHECRSACACASMSRRSCRTTRRRPPTSSTCSRGAGASWRASPTAPTST